MYGLRVMGFGFVRNYVFIMALVYIYSPRSIIFARLELCKHTNVMCKSTFCHPRTHTSSRTPAVRSTGKGNGEDTRASV